MATQTYIEQLKNKIDECLVTPIENLIQSPDWGKINFEDIEDDLKKLFDMLNHFKILPIELLPDSEIQKIIDGLTNPLKTIESIRKFDIEQANAKSTRDTLAENLKQYIDTFYVTAHLWIPYLAYQKGDVQRNIEALNSSVKKASDILENTKQDINNQKIEIDGVVSAAKEAAASVGVSHFSSNFKQEASNLNNSAINWLRATVILGGITLLATILSYWWLDIPKDSSNAQIVQVLSTKLIIITIFFTATLWAGKMYRATMHQMMVNKHRANSLLTFQTFVKASNDNHVKDAVLMETTKSIFALTASGYIDSDGPGSNQTNVIEIVKSGMESIGKATEK